MQVKITQHEHKLEFHAVVVGPEQVILGPVVEADFEHKINSIEMETPNSTESKGGFRCLEDKSNRLAIVYNALADEEIGPEDGLEDLFELFGGGRLRLLKQVNYL